MRNLSTDLPSSNSIFCLTSNWSIAAKYSNPGRQSTGGGGPIPNICWGLSKKVDVNNIVSQNCSVLGRVTPAYCFGVLFVNFETFQKV